MVETKVLKVRMYPTALYDKDPIENALHQHGKDGWHMVGMRSIEDRSNSEDLYILYLQREQPKERIFIP